MSRRRLALAAIALGLAAAVIVAVAVPEHSTSSAATPGAAKRIVVRPPRGARFVQGLLVLKPDRATIRIERQMADPLGGPPFAVRMFKAERLAPTGRHPTPAHMRLLGHDLCAQLGRIFKGRFGWIDSGGVFRPARFDYRDAPTLCGGRWRDERSYPEALVTTLITDPTLPRATATESVAWGFAGRLARTVTLRGMANAKPELSPRGAFLTKAPTYLRSGDLLPLFTYDGRPPRGEKRESSAAPPSESRLEIPRTVPNTGAIEARAPDPGGGVAWGVLGFRADTGGFCTTQPGRLVGDHVGNINFALDTFDEMPTRRRHCGATVNSLPPSWPAGFGMMFGSGYDPELNPSEDPDGGHITLRTLPGRTVFYGVARPGVRSITIESPRDVRTLIPSARARSFLVVYDGSFPTGQMKLTAVMADGSKKTVTQQAGFG